MVDGGKVELLCVINPLHPKQISALSQWFLNLLSNQAMAASLVVKSWVICINFIQDGQL